MAFINFENVGFAYPNGYSAVEDVSFEIEKGENIAIVGQNGAGKTTTVKMINGLLKPTSGKLLWQIWIQKILPQLHYQKKRAMFSKIRMTRFSIILWKKKFVLGRKC